ncbi:hypothetical protein H4S02_012583 [Coemansia sp. RSA 2611]|nr:hypothetical protein H4S02_012583 [Coemansia sp. RSA 2611]
MGIFSNRSSGDSSKAGATNYRATGRRAAQEMTAVEIEDMDIRSKTFGTTNSLTGRGRRRRSISGLKETLYMLESSDEDDSAAEQAAKTRSNNRRNSNAGVTHGADAEGNGFPAIEGYTVISRIGE